MENTRLASRASVGSCKPSTILAGLDDQLKAFSYEDSLEGG